MIDRLLSVNIIDEMNYTLIMERRYEIYDFAGHKN